MHQLVCALRVLCVPTPPPCASLARQPPPPPRASLVRQTPPPPGLVSANPPPPPRASLAPNSPPPPPVRLVKRGARSRSNNGKNTTLGYPRENERNLHRPRTQGMSLDRTQMTTGANDTECRILLPLSILSFLERTQSCNVLLLLLPPPHLPSLHYSYAGFLWKYQWLQLETQVWFSSHHPESSCRNWAENECFCL